MFSSFSLLPFQIGLPRFLQGGVRAGTGVDIKPVEIHHIEIKSDKRARSLKQLLKLNHVNYSIVYHNLSFHNHMPHILGSAYLLGASSDHLSEIYEAESKELEKWTDSPGEISKHDWRDFLGDRRYQKAYVDFFEDELILHGYDWERVIEEFLFKGDRPLINCVIAGLGHPLIHLGYAYELSSRELAMEALGLVTTSYNFLHRYLDERSYTKPPSYSTTSPLEVLVRVSKDPRLDHQGSKLTMEQLFKEHEDVIMEHWNSWNISDPKKQFEESQYAASALLAATQIAGCTAYDFFLVHLLTTNHAVRILLPLISASLHVDLLRQWWLLALAVYVTQQRPEVRLSLITDYDIKGRDWSWVDSQALSSSWALDAHFVKANRALKVAAHTWGDQDSWYLKAALKFCDQFTGWTFSNEEEATWTA